MQVRADRVSGRWGGADQADATKGLEERAEWGARDVYMGQRQTLGASGAMASKRRLPTSADLRAISSLGSDQWIASADLGGVTEALAAHARTTGRAPLMLGGWDVEDPAIAPPASLLGRLRAIQPQVQSYAYSKDFHRARALAAEVYGQGIRFGQPAENAAPLAPAQVAVAPNSSQGLLLALTALREQGVRRAVIATPCYFSVIQLCRHLGLAITFVPACDFLTGALDIPRIRRTLASGPRAALIITNPAYSVGVEYPPAQLQALFAVIPTTTYVLLDEARLGLNWTHESPWPLADAPTAEVAPAAMIYPAQTIILRSPSKIFLLNGVKTSFLFGPAPLMRAVERLSETLIGSAAGAAEEVALAYLATLQAWSGELVAGQIGPLRAWRADVVAALQRNLADAAATLTPLGFTLSPVESGPYALAAIAHGRPLAARLATDASLRAARDHGVLLLTANHFYHYADDQAGFRLNLCGDPAQTAEALARVFGV